MIKKTFFLLCVLQATLCAEFYDCFIFFNELELLKIRLEELNEVVDHFVIVEGTKTFSGEEKPLYFGENIHQFEKYRDKIIHIVVNQFPAEVGNPEIDNWTREEHQRNCILYALDNCHPDDIILVSDADEITTASAVERLKQYYSTHNFESVHGDEDQLICEVHMRLFVFHLNRENFDGWNGPAKAAPYWLLKKRFPHPLRIHHWYNKNLPHISHGGFHFSTMGGKERALLKWKSVSPEFCNRELLKRCEEDKDYLNEVFDNDKSNYTPVPVDKTFPKYILGNLEYFRTIGWLAPVTGAENLIPLVE